MFLESIQIFSKTLIAVPMVAMVVHPCRGNIGTLFRKLVRGSTRWIETFKCNLFNPVKFFILFSRFKQGDKALFIAWGKMNDTYFIAFFTIIFISIIFGSKTFNQNFHEPKILLNAKIFKECCLFRTSSIFTFFCKQ